MHDTQLYVRIGEHAPDGIGEARQTVHAGNQDVSHATVLKVGQDTEPEVSALTVRHIHAQQVLAPVLVNADDIINGTRLCRPLVVAHLVMDGIHPDDGIDCIQRTVAPRLDFVPNLLRDVADGFLGEPAAIVLLDEVADLLHALTAGVKADDLIRKALGKDRLAFPHRFRLKAAITVTGSLDLYGAILRLELLVHLAITAITA